MVKPELKNSRLWPSELREGGEDGEEMQEGPIRWQRPLQAREEMLMVFTAP